MNRKNIFNKNMLFIYILALSACAQNSNTKSNVLADRVTGLSSYKAVMSKDTSSYTLMKSQSASGSILFSHVEPSYPSSLVSLRLAPVEISAQVIVNLTGDVSEIRMSDYKGDESKRSIFEQSVHDAVIRWKYSPLLIRTETENSDGTLLDQDEAKPFSQWYAFHFEIKKDGVPAAVSYKKNDER